jgi:hypothetical protein
MSGIQLEDRDAPLADMLGWMRDKLTEPFGEFFLTGVVEVILSPEEYDLVASDPRLDLVDQRRRQSPGKLHITDFDTDVRAQGNNVVFGQGRCREIVDSHGELLLRDIA